MNYTRLQNTFTKLINRYDQRKPKIKVSLKRAGAIDPLTGHFVEGVVTTTEINAVTINYSAQQVDGSLIKVGDVRLIMNADTSPEFCDEVILDGTTWSIVQPIITHNVGGVVLGYELHLRR